MALLELDLATPAEANVAVRLARQGDPLKRIAEVLGLADFAAYGRMAESQLSNPHAEAKWLKKLGSAFLGACSLGEFVNAAALVSDVIDVSELTPRSIDSYKTVLQELARKRGLPQPAYSLVEASGPEHERMFRVGVEVGSLRAKGEGPSKKRAEEAAARELLTHRMPGEVNPVSVKARRDRSGSSFQFSRLPTRERREFEQLAMRLGMSRSVPAIARALIHPSYAFEKGLRRDETNAALALLGSAVLGVWATRLQLATLAGYGRETAPEVLTTTPWDVDVCAEAGRAMGLDRCLLLGRGETNTNRRLSGEAFQALVGALHAELGEPAQIAERMPEALELLRSSFEIGWLDTKTELDRRLGPSGISIEYEHDTQGPDHEKMFIADAVLSSPVLGESLRVVGPTGGSSKTAAEKVVAAVVQRALVADPGDPGSWDSGSTERDVQRFVTQHERVVVPTLRAHVEDWFRRGALGTAFLKQERYDSFLAWTQLLEPLDEDEEQRLRSFYRTCRASDTGADRGLIADGSRRLVEWVNTLNVAPSNVGIVEAPAFRELLDLAALTRLAASSSAKQQMTREIENFALLERTHGRDVEVGSMPDAEVLGVEGAFTLALGRVVDRMWGDRASSLRVDGHEADGMFIVTVACLEKPVSQADPPGQEDSLFAFLRRTLDMVEVQAADGLVELTLGLASVTDTMGARLLVSFLSPSRLPDPERFEIARVVHDLKNEIVAFGTSLRRWSEASGGEASMLGLQYDSARHLDVARSLASSLSTLTSSLSTPPVEDFDFVLFLQEYLSQKMLAIPTTVRLVTPRTSLPSLRVVMAPGYLRSILDNLIKNAVEAMPDGGDLGVDWAYEEGMRQLILEVRDTGTGMEPSQVAAVLSDAEVESTKQGGSALGLATVRGMVYRLGGEVDVSSAPGKGTRWTLTLPNLQESDS
jgi:dsRNA-specific ribonuclease/signal transduction histidine kinase